MTIHPTALVSSPESVPSSTNIWQFSIVLSDHLGEDSSVGAYSFIDSGVKVGSNCKIQNVAQIYSPTELEDGVFVGPGVIITNDKNPRAIGVNGARKSALDWVQAKSRICRGASLGASVTVVSPVTIGEWSMVAAGATVISDVLPHELVGGVPARHIGWVAEDGARLEEVDSETLVHPLSGEDYSWLLRKQI